VDFGAGDRRVVLWDAVFIVARAWNRERPISSIHKLLVDARATVGKFLPGAIVWWLVVARARLCPHLVGSRSDTLRAVKFSVDARLAACGEFKSFGALRRNGVTAGAGRWLRVILKSGVLAARPAGCSRLLGGGVGH